jgi:hypothetical protein
LQPRAHSTLVQWTARAAHAFAQIASGPRGGASARQDGNRAKTKTKAEQKERAEISPTSSRRVLGDLVAIFFQPTRLLRGPFVDNRNARATLRPPIESERSLP